MVECSAAQKPLHLIYLLLRNLVGESTIVFASSLQASHRLSLLLKLFGGIDVALFSSQLPQVCAQYTNHLELTFWEAGQ